MEIKKNFYNNGILKTEVPYIDHKKNGITRSYYENGFIKTEIDYCDDIIDGYVKTYYKDGSLESVETYKRGKRNKDLVVYNMRGDIIYCEYNYEYGYDELSEMSLSLKL